MTLGTSLPRLQSFYFLNFLKYLKNVKNLKNVWNVVVYASFGKGDRARGRAQRKNKNIWKIRGIPLVCLPLITVGGVCVCVTFKNVCNIIGVCC